jgi:hypothetical protein
MTYFMSYFVAWFKIRHTLCSTLWQEAKYDILYVVLCGRVQSMTYIMPHMAALLSTHHATKYDIKYVILCITETYRGTLPRPESLRTAP